MGGTSHRVRMPVRVRERWTWIAWFMAGALPVGSVLFGIYRIAWVKYRLE